jgi:hypothetical protein
MIHRYKKNCLSTTLLTVLVRTSDKCTNPKALQQSYLDIRNCILNIKILGWNLRHLLLLYKTAGTLAGS